jgi:hypothetical protein
MEKFKRHTDKATGVNAFVPKYSSSGATRMINGLFFPFRIVFLLACGILLLLVNPIAGAFRAIKLHAVANALPGPFLFLIHRLALFSAVHVAVAKQTFPAKAATGTLEGDSTAKRGHDDAPRKPSPGDVIFSNLLSPVDPFVLQSLYVGQCPLHFVFPVPKATDRVELEAKVCTGPLEAAQWILAGCGWGQKATGPAADKLRSSTASDWAELTLDLSRIQEDAKRTGAAVVCFPEGVATNGRGVLGFPSIRCESRVHAVALQYTSGNIPQPIPTTLTSFLFRASSGLAPVGMLSAPTECRVVQLRPSSVPPPQSIYSSVWSDDLRTAMVKAMNTQRDLGYSIVSLTSSSALERVAFQEHWDGVMNSH